jgi:hypothetical protein
MRLASTRTGWEVSWTSGLNKYTVTRPPGTDKNDVNGKIKGKKEAAQAIRRESTAR